MRIIESAILLSLSLLFLELLSFRHTWPEYTISPAKKFYRVNKKYGLCVCVCVCYIH